MILFAFVIKIKPQICNSYRLIIDCEVLSSNHGLRNDELHPAEDKAGEYNKWFCFENGVGIGRLQLRYQESGHWLEPPFPENAISMLTDAARRETAFLDLTLKFM